MTLTAFLKIAALASIAFFPVSSLCSFTSGTTAVVKTRFVEKGLYIPAKVYCVPLTEHWPVAMRGRQQNQNAAPPQEEQWPYQIKLTGTLPDESVIK